MEAGVRSHGTLAMQRQHARYLLERTGAIPLARLTDRKVARVLETEARGRRRLADGTVRALSGGTVRKRACTLRRALELSQGRGWLRRVPAFPDIPYRYRPAVEHLPDFAAYARMRDELEPIRRLWFVVAVWTGQRASDVERMRREDLDLELAAVRIRSTKTKREARWFHAVPELVRELEAHWRTLAPDAKLVPAWPHASSGLRKLSARLGLPRITPQRLRHSFFTWYVAANGFSAELLELGGWSDMTVPSRVYAHAAPKRLKEQIERSYRLLVAARHPPRKVSRAPATVVGKRSPTMSAAMLGHERISHAAGNSADGSGGTGVQAPVPPRPARASQSSARGMGVPPGRPPNQRILAASGATQRVGPAGIEPAAYGLKVPSPIPNASTGSLVLHPRSQSHGSEHGPDTATCHDRTG